MENTPSFEPLDPETDWEEWSPSSREIADQASRDEARYAKQMEDFRRGSPASDFQI